MKFLVILTIVGSMGISFQSCKKYEGKKDIDTRKALVGTWELRETSGGMIPGATNYPPGNGNVLKFTEDTYIISKNGQVVKSGKYLLVEDTTVEESVCLIMPKDEYTNRLVYDGDFSATKVFIEISGKRLKFVSGCYALDAGHKEEYETLATID